MVTWWHAEEAWRHHVCKLMSKNMNTCKAYMYCIPYVWTVCIRTCTCTSCSVHVHVYCFKWTKKYIHVLYIRVKKLENLIWGKIFYRMKESKKMLLEQRNSFKLHWSAKKYQKSLSWLLLQSRWRHIGAISLFFTSTSAAFLLRWVGR